VIIKPVNTEEHTDKINTDSHGADSDQEADEGESDAFVDEAVDESSMSQEGYFFMERVLTEQ
jgi:hypothetical protein